MMFFKGKFDIINEDTSTGIALIKRMFVYKSKLCVYQCGGKKVTKNKFFYFIVLLRKARKINRAAF